MYSPRGLLATTCLLGSVWSQPLGELLCLVVCRVHSVLFGIFVAPACVGAWCLYALRCRYLLRNDCRSRCLPLCGLPGRNCPTGCGATELHNLRPRNLCRKWSDLSGLSSWHVSAQQQVYDLHYMS